jgi:hypothetical protein
LLLLAAGGYEKANHYGGYREFHGVLLAGKTYAKEANAEATPTAAEATPAASGL